MATDPNDPTATPTAPVVAPTETMTFAEWCVADPTLVDADKALFDQHFKPAVEAQLQGERAALDAREAAGSAFVSYFGSRADQKMDRATLDLRIEEMTEALAPVEPPPPAG